MAYCTITEVQALNPKRAYSATTKPTSAQVEGFIARIDAEIDVVMLGRGLSTPVTSPADLATFLVQVNAYGAAALAEQAMFPEASGIGMTSHGTILWQQYQQALKYLRDGQLPTSTTSHPVPFSFFEQHEGDDVAPQADKAWPRPKFGKEKIF